MTLSNNGGSHSPSGPTHPRRFRLDERSGSAPSPLGRHVSGRRFVMGAVVTILVLWGALYLVFLQWRSGVEARIELGKEWVVAAIDPLEAQVPPNIDPEDWREGIEATRAMLTELVGTGRFDRSALAELRADINQRVAQADPDSAIDVLSRLWDDMAAKKRLREPIAAQRPSFLHPPEARTRASDDAAGATPLIPTRAERASIPG